MLSNRLNISLDSLMAAEIAGESSGGRAEVTGTILINSPHENVVVSCYKVTSSQKMKTGKEAPHFALFGVSSGCASFWGELTTFLGWYEDEEQIAKEVGAIQAAILNGQQAYELKYSVKVERHWFGMKILRD